MLLNLKFLLNELPELNFNTLKYHIEFFDEVVQNEEQNRMTAYNVAITVGPNIFRPKNNKKKDIVNVGIFYDLLIRMINDHEILFDKNLTFMQLIKKWGTQVPDNLRASLRSGVVGVMQVQGAFNNLLSTASEFEQD